ncbi:MAG: LTA synthase family protein [Proteobacteria bacterium]|nr:LTA synthase family protein [Pseudomonadota bacterium]
MLKNRFKYIYTLGFLFIIISFFTRTILILKAFSHINNKIFNLAKIYFIGFIFDISTFSYFAIVIITYLSFINNKIYTSKFNKTILISIAFLYTWLLIFISFSEYFFFDEFGVRFNFIAVDYLIYTHEVLRNIVESYPLFWILSIITVTSMLILLFIRKKIIYHDHYNFLKRLKIYSLSICIFLTIHLFVKSDFKNVSNNNYVNELSSNGIYSFFYAFKTNKIEYEKFYPSMDINNAFSNLRHLLKESNNTFINQNIFDISRYIKGQEEKEQKLNVIMIVEESLSAEYMGIFGNIYKLTPNLDKLSKESMFFTNFYATGTRTDRGLEAITLSVPPIPGRSILKRQNNENLNSLGYIFNEKGYDVNFLYGGYSYFDNMKHFFSNNNFKVIDLSNFSKEEITFQNAWGLCDEDVFNKAIKISNESYRIGKPFFTLIMTTSNHRPYTYPDGKIDIPSHSGREGAVKYADYALGKFINDAKKYPWYENTVFVIVADHCASSAGRLALPVNKYHIPLLIYSPRYIKPIALDKQSSQIDLAPTILGLLNFNYKSKFYGKNILRMKREDERAFISTYQRLGYMKGNRLIVLDLMKKKSFYTFDKLTGFLTPISKEDTLLNEAITYYQTADYLYKNNLLKH